MRIGVGAGSEVEVEGKIKVTFEDGSKVEVDADAYMAELRNEVKSLRGELARAKQGASDAQGGELLAYMQVARPTP